MNRRDIIKKPFPKKHKITERLKTYSVDFIFDFIRLNPEADYYVDPEGNRCKLRRAKIYYKMGIECVSCDIKATFFALEVWPAKDVHFDLYGIDKFGDEALITIDHILAKANGGKDHISNYQPLCSVCNATKSNIQIDEIVLYCGMADDILSPLLLVPNLAKLYVIDQFDSAFAKDRTWEGQKSDIKQMLLTGNDKNSQHREVYLHYKDEWPVTKLEEKCHILNSSESDDGKCWRFMFYYKNVRRELIYFHHTNFISVWPEEIKKVKHLMSMGASFPGNSTELHKMIKERTTDDCKYYMQYNQFWHKDNPELMNIANVRCSDVLIRNVKDINEYESKETSILIKNESNSPR